MIRARAPHLLSWLALCLVVMMFGRALVPAGFMPATDVDQQIRMVMCTGFGPATPQDRDGAQDPSQPAHDQNPCAFAASTPLSDLVSGTAAVPAPIAQTLVRDHHIVTTAPILHNRHDFAARAPPAAV